MSSWPWSRATARATRSGSSAARPPTTTAPGCGRPPRPTRPSTRPGPGRTPPDGGDAGALGLAAVRGVPARQARDLYTRRNEGVSIWVVAAADITASSPDEKDPFFAPSGDKVYRHPTFYEIPDDVPHM